MPFCCLWSDHSFRMLRSGHLARKLYVFWYHSFLIRTRISFQTSCMLSLATRHYFCYILVDLTVLLLVTVVWLTIFWIKSALPIKAPLFCVTAFLASKWCTLPSLGCTLAPKSFWLIAACRERVSQHECRVKRTREQGRGIFFCGIMSLTMKVTLRPPWTLSCDQS